MFGCVKDSVSAWLSPKSVDSGVAAVETADPWGSPPQSNVEQMGDWADFSSVNFEANFDAAFDKTDVTSSVVENDVKVESNEIIPKTDKDKCNVSIETVAQTTIKEDEKKEEEKNEEEKKEKEAGDLCETKDNSQLPQPVIEPSK